MAKRCPLDSQAWANNSAIRLFQLIVGYDWSDHLNNRLEYVCNFNGCYSRAVIQILSVKCE